MNNRVAVITGTSSGIGLLSTVELARNGFRVVATMRNLERRTALDQALASAGVAANVDIRQLDVTKPESISACIGSVVRDHGRIDLLVNNAGFPLAGFAEDVQLEELREQFETNFFGHVSVTRAALPTMRTQKSGQIIMISSIAGRAGQPSLSSYCSSKYALEGWTESLRMEIRSVGIKVSLIEPGAYDTDIWLKNAKLARGAFDNSSPNIERARRFRDFVTSGKIRKGDPRKVAQLVVRVANDPHPKVRYVIGHDAHLQVWLKRLTPFRVYEKLITKAIKID
ncbi:MAG TPA: SDR family oxidoreductase [Terriglobales bacterium]|nr:SDR family oxidoreductase [Terriglobales bacterium]